jgi:hypothetical protein
MVETHSRCTFSGNASGIHTQLLALPNPAPVTYCPFYATGGSMLQTGLHLLHLWTSAFIPEGHQRTEQRAQLATAPLMFETAPAAWIHDGNDDSDSDECSRHAHLIGRTPQ